MDGFQTGKVFAIVQAHVMFGRYPGATEIKSPAEVVTTRDPDPLLFAIHKIAKHQIEVAMAGSSSRTVVIADVMIWLGSAEDIISLRRGLSTPATMLWSSDGPSLLHVMQRDLQDKIQTHFN